MAVPPALLEQHRRAQRHIDELAERSVLTAFRSSMSVDAAATTAALQRQVRAIVETFGEMSAVQAADFYDEARSTTRAHGSFTARTGSLPPTDQIDAVTRWAVTPLWSTDPRTGAALRQLTGGTGRIIRSAGNDTIADNAIADPESTGWQRITRAGACKFCRMLAGRGDQVYSEDTVRFAAHDNCHCTAAPSWDPGAGLDVIQFVASKRTQTAADRQRVRDWMRENLDD